MKKLLLSIWAVLLISLLLFASCQNKPVTELPENSLPAESSLPESDPEETDPPESSLPVEDEISLPVEDDLPPQQPVIYNEEGTVAIPIKAELPAAETREPIQIQEEPGYGTGWEDFAVYEAEVLFDEGFAFPEDIPVYQYQPNDATMAVGQTLFSLFPELTVVPEEDSPSPFFGSTRDHTKRLNVSLQGTEFGSRVDLNLASGHIFAYRMPMKLQMDGTSPYEFDPYALAEIACKTAMEFHDITGDLMLTEYEEDIWHFDYRYEEDGICYSQYATAVFRFKPVVPHAGDQQKLRDYMEICVTPDGQIYTIENYISTAELVEVGIIQTDLTKEELQTYFSECSTENETFTFLSAKAYSRDDNDVDILRPTVEFTYRVESTGELRTEAFAANEAATFALFGGGEW